MAGVYTAPFVAYLLGTSFIARFGDAWYPLLYGLVVIGIGIGLPWLLWKTKALRPHWRVAPGIALGVVGIGIWIWLCSLHAEQLITQFLPVWLQPQDRVGFNPLEQLEGRLVWMFVAVRLLGIAIIVPVAEELFWRGFLLRWLIDPDWEKVPLGEFTLASCAIVTLMFSLAHPEWLAAAVYCLLMNGLFYWKKDLWQCVIAHGVSNFLLAIYVLYFEAWQLW